MYTDQVDSFQIIDNNWKKIITQMCFASPCYFSVWSNRSYLFILPQNTADHNNHSITSIAKYVVTRELSFFCIVASTKNTKYIPNII